MITGVIITNPKLKLVKGQMLAGAGSGFSEGSMGADIHPFPDGAEDGLMDVSQSSTYFMSAPASGPMEGDLAKIQQFV
eukprot:CAMPEP_0174926102 /NCGR_PEP_ID=MMETSP1355-20121228/9758_1 /TAXON_ID=464990 /ORGANISM="Hemiselmis tepida, Strain CCMP443" /LENGTH=77 /DNA_ID=CAMNT_0016172111 /DNA_START=26 /DNA_END=259 /DNA_ORIENTATION=-